MSKVLLIVHGAGKTMSDFYKKPVADLGVVLGQDPDCLPCWYGDLSNIGAPVFGPPDPEADAFRTSFVVQLKIQSEEITAEAPAGAANFGLADTAATVADLVADVTRYLYDSTLRDPMRQRLQDVLEQAKAYDETILVSHSLGTVLTFDVLCEHADEYNVSHFITMGSPLRKVVIAGARTSKVGAITKQNVAMWRNIYDSRDLVANVLGPVFTGYPLEDVHSESAGGLIRAHDYWGRDTIVRAIADYLK